MLDAVVCLWEWDKPDNHRRALRPPWRLVEAFGCDHNGYPCTPTQHATNDNRCPWFDWTHTKPESENGDRDQIPGRLVTLWTLRDGVRLVSFHEPEPYTAWLSPLAEKWLCDSESWEWLEGGYQIWGTTGEAAQKLLESAPPTVVTPPA